MRKLLACAALVLLAVGNLLAEARSGGFAARLLAALRDETARTYAEVLERLAGAGLLDSSEASALKPDLTLSLYDQRDRRTFPLPEKLGGVRVHVVGEAAS